MPLKVNIEELSYSWEEYVSDYPKKGQPGITHRTENPGPDAIHEVLLYYDADGSLAGVLYYF